MTVAPQYPLEHAYLGDENPEELIPSPFGVMERWRAQAMQTGELSGLAALRDHIKNDAVSALDAVEERERVVTARERAADARDRAFKDAVATFMDRAAPFVDRIAQARADQQREPEEPLAAPPGDAALPGDPSKQPEPALPLADATPVLHSIRGKQNPDVEPDARGGFLRLEDDQAEFPDPELAHPPVVQQPIAAGLDRAQ